MRILLISFFVIGFLQSCNNDSPIPILCAPDSTSLRFAVASDGHLSSISLSSYQDYSNLFAWFSLEKTTYKLDFAFLLGDLVQDEPELLIDIKLGLDSLEYKVFPVKGNHDMCNEEFWNDIFHVKPNYYFKFENFGFIILDTSNEDGEYLCPDVSFLKTALQHLQGTIYTFVFLHISPLGSFSSSVKCKEFIQEVNLKSVVVFQGHNHNFDGTQIHNNIHYFWDGRFGSDYGIGYKGYRIIQVDSDGNICTYQYNPSSKSIMNLTEIR